MRSSARTSGRFLKREMVGCEHRSVPSGRRPIASLNIGSLRRRSASLTGLVAAYAIAGALSSYPRQAGAVSALFGAMQYGGGILGSALVGFLADATAWPMGLTVGVGGVGTLLCAWMVTRSD
jgi:MFS family permease